MAEAVGRKSPDIVKFPDGRFRMYFQNAGMIKSVISHDGLVGLMPLVC